MRLRAVALAAALVLTGSPAYAVTGPTTVTADGGVTNGISNYTTITVV